MHYVEAFGEGNFFFEWTSECNIDLLATTENWNEKMFITYVNVMVAMTEILTISQMIFFSNPVPI